MTIQLRVIRSRIGFDCTYHIDTGTTVLSNCSSNSVIIRLDNTFSLVTPCEFDAILLHVFLKGFPTKFIEFNDDPVEQESDGVRDIQLDFDEKPIENECNLNFSKKNVYGINILQRLRLIFMGGISCPIFDGVIGDMDPYWMFSLRYRNQDSRFMHFPIRSISDANTLATLSCMGYSANITDHLRQARHMYSNEMYQFKLEKNDYNDSFNFEKNDKLDLRIVIEGIHYSPRT